MRHLQISLLLLLVGFSTGCPKPKYAPSVDFKNPSSLVGKINEHIDNKRRAYESAMAENPPNMDRAMRIRNELIEDAIPFIDGSYLDFITAMQAGRDRNNFVLDLVELGAAASVGITKGERPLQIIGVALTAFRGGRRSLDANFYKDQSTPILISKMDGNRAKVRATILTREKGKPDDYSLGAAVADLVDYYNAGTLVRAFTQLQQDTAVITKESEDKVRILKGVPITPETTPEFRNLSVAASDILQDLFNTLADPATKSAATSTLQSVVLALEGDVVVAPVLKKANIASSSSDGNKLREGLIAIRRSAALVNDNALLNKINQAIVDNKPAPTTTPTPTPTVTP
jgi:hypothetical protein